MLFLLITLQPFCGVHIYRSSISPTYVAVGEGVTLLCLFSLAPEDSGGLDIEWRIKPADIDAPERFVIWYSGSNIYTNNNSLGLRVQFVNLNPAGGDASISITRLEMTDTNTYQCKVRKSPGIKSRVIFLKVMERPTKPECYAESEIELNRKVTFRCRGAQGSPPIWYGWSMDVTGKWLPADAIVNPRTGDLVLTITEDLVPRELVCTVQNRVAMETCLVMLEVKPRSDTAAAAGIVGAFVVLMLITITIIVVCKRRKKIFGNEILEDELPPRTWLSKTNRNPDNKSPSQGSQDQRPLENGMYMEMKVQDVPAGDIPDDGCSLYASVYADMRSPDTEEHPPSTT